MGEKKEKKSKKKDAPAEEKAADALAAAAPAKKKTVNVFALFKQAQISEFKEAFALMDLNKDGVLDEADFKGIWQQAGRDVDDKTAADMIAECTGSLTSPSSFNCSVTRCMVLTERPLSRNASACSTRRRMARLTRPTSKIFSQTLVTSLTRKRSNRPGLRCL